MRNDNRIYKGINKKMKSGRRFVNTTSTKYVRMRNRHVNWGVVIAVALFAVLLAVSIIGIATSPKKNDTTEAKKTSSAPTATAAETAEDSAFDYITVSNTAVHEGNLILVSLEHEYEFPKSTELISVYENKTRSYKVSTSKLKLTADTVDALNSMFDDFYADTGCHDVLITAAYKTYDEIMQSYNEYAAKFGKEDADDSLAAPGCSEHHTGLSFDLGVYTDDGKSYAFGRYETVDWLRARFPDYGFILRYPENKAEITKVTYEGYHYRYVGVAHAKIMQYLELCLEEYIAYVKDYRFDGRYLTLLDDGDVSYMKAGIQQKCPYAVYFVPASGGASTSIPIPKGAEYEISGNNIDGFIVTLIKN